MSYAFTEAGDGSEYFSVVALVKIQKKMILIRSHADEALNSETMT